MFDRIAADISVATCPPPPNLLSQNMPNADDETIAKPAPAVDAVTPAHCKHLGVLGVSRPNLNCRWTRRVVRGLENPSHTTSKRHATDKRAIPLLCSSHETSFRHSAVYPSTARSASPATPAAATPGRLPIPTFSPIPGTRVQTISSSPGRMHN